VGEKSGVSWTESSHNFWYGCQKVSPGCKFCYAERQMSGYGRDFHTVTRAKGFDKPLHWRKGRRIFVTPWSDFFLPGADEWRDDAWNIMRQTPQHTYLILTKRPEYIEKRLPTGWRGGWPNVWLGVSAEMQSLANQRIPILLSIPAAIHFVSCEPLLGPICLDDYFAWTFYNGEQWEDANSLDWVIAGGESGSHQKDPRRQRLMDMAWARDLRDQCVDFGIPFWLKQDSDVRAEQRSYIVEEDGTHSIWHQLPETPFPSEQKSLF
jgi:protein gp37